MCLSVTKTNYAVLMTLIHMLNLTKMTRLEQEQISLQTAMEHVIIVSKQSL